MKKHFLLFLVLPLTLTLNGQAYKDSVKAQFLRYTDLLIHKQTATSMAYVNPAFFKLVPKAQLIKLIDQVYNMPGLDFKMENPAIVSVDDNRFINAMNYVKLTYTSTLFMHFATDDGKRKDSTALKNAFGKQFGPENVS